MIFKKYLQYYAMESRAVPQFPPQNRLHTKTERRNALRSRFYSAYSVPVTTTLVTPGVTVTAPVAASWA